MNIRHSVFKRTGAHPLQPLYPATLYTAVPIYFAPIQVAPTKAELRNECLGLLLHQAAEYSSTTLVEPLQFHIPSHLLQCINSIDLLAIAFDYPWTLPSQNRTTLSFQLFNSICSQLKDFPDNFEFNLEFFLTCSVRHGYTNASLDPHYSDSILFALVKRETPGLMKQVLQKIIDFTNDNSVSSRLLFSLFSRPNADCNTVIAAICNSLSPKAMLKVIFECIKQLEDIDLRNNLLKMIGQQLIRIKKYNHFSDLQAMATLPQSVTQFHLFDRAATVLSSDLLQNILQSGDTDKLETYYEQAYHADWNDKLLNPKTSYNLSAKKAILQSFFCGENNNKEKKEENFNPLACIQKSKSMAMLRAYKNCLLDLFGNTIQGESQVAKFLIQCAKSLKIDNYSDELNICLVKLAKKWDLNLDFIDQVQFVPPLVNFSVFSSAICLQPAAPKTIDDAKTESKLAPQN